MSESAAVGVRSRQARSARKLAAVRWGMPYPGKRSLDVLGSTLLLILTSPLLGLCALLLKLSSKGPVLFGHRRCGRNGESFECLKFRTMVENAEEWLDEDGQLRAAHRENGFKLPTDHDPRVTPLGRVLRRTHLDELPQLLNVIRGEMSLVGPRPIVVEELELYGERAEEFLSVRPGIFGPWTALGKKRPQYPERCDVELSYRSSASLASDIGLLLRNVVVVFKGQ